MGKREQLLCYVPLYQELPHWMSSTSMLLSYFQDISFMEKNDFTSQTLYVEIQVSTIPFEVYPDSKIDKL